MFKNYLKNDETLAGCRNLLLFVAAGCLKNLLGEDRSTKKCFSFLSATHGDGMLTVVGEISDFSRYFSVQHSPIQSFSGQKSEVSSGDGYGFSGSSWKKN